MYNPDKHIPTAKMCKIAYGLGYNQARYTGAENILKWSIEDLDKEGVTKDEVLRIARRLGFDVRKRNGKWLFNGRVEL